jgi:SSS family solute:Na+ symporter
MSGSGFAMGLTISSYEWLSAASLLIVAVSFIPLYLQHRIYTMPQFLAQRYNNTVATIMAVFWLLLYVFVNLTSILYLRALAIESITGLPFLTCMLGVSFICYRHYTGRYEGHWLYRYSASSGFGFGWFGGDVPVFANGSG